MLLAKLLAASLQQDKHNLRPKVTEVDKLDSQEERIHCHEATSTCNNLNLPNYEFTKSIHYNLGLSVTP